MAKPSKPPLRILCFGDSLTEGYNNYGLSLDPYSRTMQELLEARIGDEYEIEVETDGVSGELVTGGGFERRMRGWYAFKRGEQGGFDWVIFLGGTNDLGWGKSPVEIYAAIKAMTSLPLENGARVLLMTVPECAVRSKSLDSKRDELNGMIREREGVYIFDLKEKIPYHSLDEKEREEIWDDGLHFSKKGYERLGEMVGECLVGILGNDRLK